MRNGAELCPGGAYLLDDFTVIQVLAVEDGWIRYRVRTGMWRPRIRIRRIRLARLMRKVRAEVNGDFFPVVVLPGLRSFGRPAAETAALDAHLTERAPHRPFAGS